MANRLTMAEIDRIVTLHTTEHSNREIARLLGVNAIRSKRSRPDHSTYPGSRFRVFGLRLFQATRARFVASGRQGRASLRCHLPCLQPPVFFAMNPRACCVPPFASNGWEKTERRNSWKRRNPNTRNQNSEYFALASEDLLRADVADGDFGEARPSKILARLLVEDEEELGHRGTGKGPFLTPSICRTRQRAAWPRAWATPAVG